MTLDDALEIIDVEMDRSADIKDYSLRIKLHFIKQHIIQHSCAIKT